MSSSNLYITKLIEQNSAADPAVKKLARFLVQRGAIDNSAVLAATATSVLTTTLTAIPGLAVDAGVGFNSNAPLVGGRTYKFRGYLPCTVNGTSGITMDWAGGTATFSAFSAVGLNYVGSTATVVQTTASTGLTANAAAAYTLMFVEGSFTVNNSGTFIPRMALFTGTATAATLTIGSYVSVTEIAQGF